jgi:hypothetical protein
MIEVFEALYSHIILAIFGGEQFTEEIIANVGLAMDYYIPRMPDQIISVSIQNFQTLFSQVVRIAG